MCYVLLCISFLIPKKLRKHRTRTLRFLVATVLLESLKASRFPVGDVVDFCSDSRSRRASLFLFCFFTMGLRVLGILGELSARVYRLFFVDGGSIN